MNIPLKKIVIIGGGVGGLELATQLGRKLGRYKKAEVTLVDRNYSHLWKPLLHKVAAGSLNEDINSLSYLIHAHNHHFHFQLGTIVDINRKSKTVILKPLHDKKGTLLIPERNLKYDILVIALGSVSNDFNIPGVKENCIFLDSPYQARRFRCEIIDLLLKYSNNLNTGNKIDIAIIGGGATGVELSAELHNLVEQLYKYGYKRLVKNSLNVILIEASERILPALPLRVSNLVHDKLSKIGIRILTQTTITSVDEGGIHTKNGEYIKADLMTWTAGIKAPDFMKNIGGLETNHINQLIVETTLKTTRDSSIFAIGDCASCINRHDGGFVPPRAQAAHQMASLVLYNIMAQIKNKPLRPYTYKDHGSLISLSNYSTIGNLISNLYRDSIIIEGRIARFIYVILYRMHQITLHGYFRTGLMILIDSISYIINSSLKLHY